MTSRKPQSQPPRALQLFAPAPAPVTPPASHTCMCTTVRRWAAIGVRAYFHDNWNKFDCVIVVLSVMGVLLDFITPGSVSFLPAIRVFRIAALFRLIPRSKSLRRLVQTLFW